jgi:hypothetical protein
MAGRQLRFEIGMYLKNKNVIAMHDARHLVATL